MWTIEKSLGQKDIIDLLLYILSIHYVYLKNIPIELDTRFHVTSFRIHCDDDDDDDYSIVYSELFAITVNMFHSLCLI